MIKILKSIIKKVLSYISSVVYATKLEFKWLLRIINKENYKNSYTFSIICVNRVEYVDLAINNINSLHYFNHSHTFKIYCDSVCFSYLEKKKNKLDYETNVELIKEWEVLDFPWQFAKIRLLEKYLGREDIIFLDADIKWLKDPVIDKSKLTFFINEYNLSSSTRDMLFLHHCMPELDAKKINHCNVTLLSIPIKFQTSEFVNEWSNLANKINKFSDVPLMSAPDIRQMNRLCEQMSASIVSQRMFSENVTVLQDDSNQYIHSYYYGAVNGIQ